MNIDQRSDLKKSRPEIEKEKQLVLGYASETVASEKHPERNEDTVLIDAQHNTFGVFDGVGGNSSGELASKTACKYVLTNLGELPDGIDVTSIKRCISEIFNEANKAVQNASPVKEGDNVMATTGTVLKIYTDKEGNHYALIAHVGDSRAYKIENGILKQITADDDLLSTSFPSGKKRDEMAEHIANAKTPKDLTTFERTFFSHRMIISNALGLCEYNPPSIYTASVKKGDVFLISSDGLHDNLTKTEIEDICKQQKTLEEIAKELKDKAFARSKESRSKEMRAKQDDISLVLVEVK